jgi:hypothetical protein
MSLWTIRRSALDVPATGVPATNVNDRVALPIIQPMPLPVDVVRHYYWTHSPRPASREEVPYIKLTEKRLRTNALISQLKYSLGLTANGANEIAQQLASRPDASKLLKTIAGDVQTGAGLITSVSDKILPGNANDTAWNSPYLVPYRNLYLTENTGWKFFLPYFENAWDGIQNQFSSSGPTNALGTMAQAGSEFLTGVTEMLAATNRPFEVTYVERSKFFNYSDDGEDITITFPLINTGQVEFNDVFNNWQLIFLLMYNNRPGKTSINTVEQPVIYEAEIPGVKFFPYAYISQLSVDFQGARRRLVFDVPYAETQTTVDTTTDGTRSVSQLTSSHKVEAIVPDAYMVKIVLHGLNSTTRNFMYHMLTKQEIVQATEV